jgi:hypothetical protein
MFCCFLKAIINKINVNQVLTSANTEDNPVQHFSSFFESIGSLKDRPDDEENLIKNPSLIKF